MKGWERKVITIELDRLREGNRMRLADSVPSSEDLLAIASELEDEALNVFIQEGDAVLPLTDAMMDNARNLRKACPSMKSPDA